MDKLHEFKKNTMGLTADEIVKWTFKTFDLNRIAVASSFSIEDQVLTDMSVKMNSHARIFTLDTGRHFQETYDVMQKSIEFWNISYEVCFPDPDEISAFTKKNGPNAFYKSIDLRKECCAIRKTRPLQKLLSTVDVWIVGLRSEQSVTRFGLEPIEWDYYNNVYKISPLYNWSEQAVVEYVQANNIPISDLYNKGFRSIGCAPCTRAISKDEDVRAGRWWWEAPEHKECGLHNRKQ